jgi:putative redox protein
MATEATNGGGAGIDAPPRPGKLATVTLDGGLRFTTEIRGHLVPTDQPAYAGGGDSAAAPLELMAAALGGCIALYAHQFCQAREIPQPGMRVEVRWETAKSPGRIGRFDVRVILPAELPQEYRTAIERAVRSCPVHNTLTHPPEIDVQLVELAGA